MVTVSLSLVRQRNDLKRGVEGRWRRILWSVTSVGSTRLRTDTTTFTDLV